MILAEAAGRVVDGFGLGDFGFADISKVWSCSCDASSKSIKEWIKPWEDYVFVTNVSVRTWL